MAHFKTGCVPKIFPQLTELFFVTKKLHRIGPSKSINNFSTNLSAGAVPYISVHFLLIAVGICTYFKKWANPSLFFVYFRSFLVQFQYKLKKA